MFANLGQFSKESIRISFIGYVYPCLIFAVSLDFLFIPLLSPPLIFPSFLLYLCDTNNTFVVYSTWDKELD